jgi:hypothetical protein
MEETKEQNDSNENSDKVEPLEPLTTAIKHESTSDKDDIKNQNLSDFNQNESVGQSSRFPNGNNNKWTISDKLSLTQTAINAVMTVATLILLYFGFQQISEARKSNAISENNYKLAKKALEDGEIESKKRYKLDSTSTVNRIEALNNQVNILKREFEIVNDPIIDLNTVIKLDITPEKQVFFSFTLVNHSKRPAEIVGTKASYIIVKNNPPIDFIISEIKKVYDDYPFTQTNKNYVSEIPTNFSCTFGKEITDEEIQDVKNGIRKIYFGISYDYKGLGMSKIKKLFIVGLVEGDPLVFTPIRIFR